MQAAGVTTRSLAIGPAAIEDHDVDPGTCQKKRSRDAGETGADYDNRGLLDRQRLGCGARRLRRQQGTPVSTPFGLLDAEGRKRYGSQGHLRRQEIGFVRGQSDELGKRGGAVAALAATHAGARQPLQCREIAHILRRRSAARHTQPESLAAAHDRIIVRSRGPSACGERAPQSPLETASSVQLPKALHFGLDGCPPTDPPQGFRRSEPPLRDRDMCATEAAGFPHDEHIGQRGCAMVVADNLGMRCATRNRMSTAKKPNQFVGRRKALADADRVDRDRSLAAPSIRDNSLFRARAALDPDEPVLPMHRHTVPPQGR